MMKNIFRRSLTWHFFSHATIYPKFYFSRQVSKPKLFYDADQEELQAIEAQIKTKNFQTIDQIDLFIQDNETLSLTEWTYVVAQMIKLNHKQILELDHQSSIIKALPLPEFDTFELKEFVSGLIYLLTQFKQHKFMDEGLKPLLNYIKAHVNDQSLQLFDHLTLLQVLELFESNKDAQFAQSWVSMMEQILDNKPKLTLSKRQVQAIYRLLNTQQVSNNSRNKFLNLVEQNVERFISTFQKTDLLLLVRYNTFKQRIYNAEIMSQFTKRIVQFAEQFTIEEIAQINRFLNFLKIQDPQWLNVQSQIVTDMLSEENKQKPILAELNDLVESLQNTTDSDCLRPILIPYFKLLEGYLMSRIHLMEIRQQLEILRLHSLLIESIHFEKASSSDFRTSTGDKRLEKLNNQYYETIIPYLNEMNYKETLIFLENVSVLGVSKRKVCQLVLDRGLYGLKQFNQQNKEDKDYYALLSYYKLLKLFITSKDQLILIEQTFQDVAVNTLELETNYGHLAIRRDKLIDL